MEYSMEYFKPTHILVLFCAPGPRDVTSELNHLVPRLLVSNNLRLAKDFKMRVIIEAVSDSADFKRLREEFLAWVNEEDDALSVQLKEISMNTPGKRYKFFQVAWAIPLNVESDSAIADIFDIVLTIESVSQEFESHQKPIGSKLKTPDSYSSALQSFEELIGREVTDSFSISLDNSVYEKHLLYEIFRIWQNIFETLATTADCLPLAIPNPSDYLLKRSLLYSTNIVAPLRGIVTHSWDDTQIPASYIAFLRKYHGLIRKNVACVVMGEWDFLEGYRTFLDAEYEDEMEEEGEEFDPGKYGCAIVTDTTKYFLQHSSTDSLHFKILLPDISGVDLKDLLKLVQDEEIFTNYHNTINLLNIQKHANQPDQVLKELILEVDDKTRDLNSQFKQLAKKRRWQAIRSIGGLSVTGFSYLLPPDLGSTVRAISGTLSAISVIDGALGIIQTENELRTNPYFFSYTVGRLSRKR